MNSIANWSVLSLLMMLFLGSAAPTFAQETNSKEERRLRLVSIGTQDEIVKLVNANSQEKAIRNPELESKARAIIQRIYNTFVKEIPEIALLKIFPDFAITDSDSEVDFGVFFPNPLQLKDKYSAILLIPRQALKINLGEEVFTGIVAHEMAHLLLNHKIRLGQFWDPEINGDPAPEGTKEKMSRYLYLTKLVGEDFTSELGGVALNGDLGWKLGKMLKEMESIATQANDNCGKEGLKEFESLQEFVMSLRDKWSLQLNLKKATDARALKQRVENFKQSIKACAAKVKFQGIKLEIWMTIKPDGWSTSFPSVVEPILGRSPEITPANEFDVLFEVGAKVQNEMYDLWSTHQLGQVIWRSPEDEADDFAIGLMHVLGIDPIRYMAVMFLYSSVHPKIEDFKECVQLYGQGIAAPIGSPSEPHHAPCHRVHKMLRTAGFKPTKSK